jgi:hypothetical protein
MKVKNIFSLFVLLLVIGALVLSSVTPAFAKDENEAEFTGHITAINAATRTLTVAVPGGATYTVLAPASADLSTFAVGDLVEVEGTLNADGSVAAFKLKQEERRGADKDDDKADDKDNPADGFYCTQSETPHPFGARLAERYGVAYATLQGWFCEGRGWGEIMLALKTAEITGDAPGALLQFRSEGQGWGQIWKAMKLIGRSEDAGPPNDLDGDGRPDHAKGPKKDKPGNSRP